MRDFLNVTAHMLGKASGLNSATHIQSCIKRARQDGNIYNSSSQGVIAHMLGIASGSNSATHNQSCTKRARHDGNIYSSSSQGVIALPDGNWAAHVYVNDNWILQGIYDTEMEAVIAYESTTLNRLMECCKTYLKGIISGAQEPLTLEQASIDSIRPSSFVNIPQEHENQKCIRTRLFGKKLTTSDVKADKLVIPKMYASCFPSISNGDESSSEEQPVSDVELGFYDQSMTLWKFRYCYWKKSKTYSISRGWRKFVQEKGLSLMDTVIFFKCERVEATSIVDPHFVIDVEYANKEQVEKVGANMGESVVCSRSEGVQILQNKENGGGTAGARHVTKIQVDKDLEGAGAGAGAGAGKASEASEKLVGVKIAGAGKTSEASVKLFGVNITGAGAGAGKAYERSVNLFGVKIA